MTGIPSLWSTNLNAPSGISRSNCAPSPKVPVSWMVIPVMSRMSRMMKSPYPVFFPNPRSKIFSLLICAIPSPSSDTEMISPSGTSLQETVIRVSSPACLRALSSRL